MLHSPLPKAQPAVVDGDDHKSLFSIPLEILEHILLFCSPRDVARFAGSCRFCEDLVYRAADQYFWRQLFLVLFDDPRHAINPPNTDLSSFDWKGELVQRMRAERVAFATGPASIDRRSVLETLVSVAQQALPMSRAGDGTPASNNVEWLDNVLRNTDILESPFLPSEAQFGDRLKTCMALSLKEETEDNVEELRDLRTRSRCFVYDLQNYHVGNHWGPFHLDGEVNWIHMNHIINVVTSNLRECPEPLPPHGLEATRAHSAPGPYSADDWAGVEGTWQRYVCFMDYRALFEFNFEGIPRDPQFFDDPSFREATRPIEINMYIIPREKMRVKFPINDPPANTHPDYPTIYFSGVSRGASLGQEVTVQGFVYMPLDCSPRWRFTSIHDGEPQWSSEGVQIGGICSAMGLCGIWSAFHHGIDDPAGPFWAWKVSG
ncbi:hypothetical protein GGX14DRAFT_422797 [Mycena pura]|uniref:F-box domain-containing protein n=1 Tax=Mycena pura TaxID=153505 RepID=A0AAD6YQJ1_9AGAR|nr:hypothetical protein GGX14DRAFT_422797 [Mycena pura]